MIDYGNAPTLTLAERLDVARLVVALDDRDDAAILRAFAAMGYTIKGNTGGASKAFADKMLLFSAYGDFDQQYDPRFFDEP